MKRVRKATLAIHLLGPFRVSVLGSVVDDSRWARPQAKLLLKLLALAPKHQLHRQKIMDTIWPELDEKSAAANLHKIIHMARRALEPNLKSAADSTFIRTRDQHVVLVAPGGPCIDVEEFEKGSTRAVRSGGVSECEDLLSIYLGDLLSEDLYADWFARRRDQLRVDDGGESRRRRSPVRRRQRAARIRGHRLRPRCRPSLICFGSTAASRW